MTIHQTKGIVIKTVKYGETSVIVTIYTELFGVQSYIVNGVRTSSKKGMGKANLFQPAAILDLQAYHNELHNLQRLKEFKWGYLYQHLYFDVVKNAVSLFMIEMLQKTLKQPEANPSLFYFIEDAFIHLDSADEQVVANYPLYFSLHLATFLGFQLSDTYTGQNTYFDLKEGQFVDDHPIHPDFLQNPYSHLTSQLLKVMQPHELKEFKLNFETRRILLQAYQTFYALHIHDFGTMRTWPVLQQIFS